MLSTHHSDKWSTLRGLKDSEGRPVLDALTSSDAAKQRAAIERITNALQENFNFLDGEILHAGTQGLADMAFNGTNDSGAIGDLIATVFKRTLDKETLESRKKGILKTAFYAATEGDTAEEKNLAVTLLDKLHDADPVTTRSVIERSIFPQSWDETMPLAEVLQHYRP